MVDAVRWRRLQEHFSQVLGLAVRTLGPSGELLVEATWPANLDADRVIAALRIGEELDQLLPGAAPLSTTSTITTSLGVTYAAIPIRTADDNVLAAFVLGPVIVGPRINEVAFIQQAKDAGVMDLQAAWNIILALRLYSFVGMRSVLDLVEEVGASLVQFAYQAKRLGEIVPSSRRVDRAVITYYTDRVLSSLLEAATYATQADGGSVMTYDEQGQALEIKAAQGLSEAVAGSVRLGRGEGLAGLAASERRIFLIDDQTTDTRLRERMRQKDLVSSLVAPLIPEAAEDPIGVLNLRTRNPEKRFTAEHIELLRRLLDLAGVALGGLRLTLQPTNHTS